ncbi:hypothetical protein N9137_00940 [Pseudomonadales bacterium]|nr:hypothetical protein [Pseudomonadales bacterium]
MSNRTRIMSLPDDESVYCVLHSGEIITGIVKNGSIILGNGNYLVMEKIRDWQRIFPERVSAESYVISVEINRLDEQASGLHRSIEVMQNELRAIEKKKKFLIHERTLWQGLP